MSPPRAPAAGGGLCGEAVAQRVLHAEEEEKEGAGGGTPAGWGGGVSGCWVGCGGCHVSSCGGRWVPVGVWWHQLMVTRRGAR